MLIGYSTTKRSSNVNNVSELALCEPHFWNHRKCKLNVVRGHTVDMSNTRNN